MRRVRVLSLIAATALLGTLLLAGVSMRYRLEAGQQSPSVLIVSELRAPPSVTSPRPEARAPSPEPPPEPVPNPASAPAQPAPAALPASGGAPPLILEPRWIERPRHPERFYPRDAFVRGIDGRVELACFVEIDGRLTCEVATETPPGHGFGDAALALARAHVMQPAVENGVPVRARYRMVVPFSSQ
jgi:protein TonB